MSVFEQFPTLRQSRLVTFDSCALRAFFEETYRRDWTGHPQARGQLVHRVYARAMRIMHEQHEQQIPTDAMLELLLDELRMPHEELINIPLREVKDIRWEVVKWATDNKFDIENLVDVEHRLSAKLAYDGPDGSKVERTLTGQLDAMFVAGERDEEAVVLDWKSTWDLPAPAEVGFEGYFQQRWYAWLVMRNYPAIERVTLREHYTRYSQSRQATVYRDDIDHSEGVEAELAALAQRFDRAFANNEFPPSPGRHCQLCPKPTSCPIFPDVKVEGMITDERTAEKVAGELQVAKAALKQREAALKAWASVHGAVAINSTPGRERVWGYRARKRVSRPTRDELEKAMFVNSGRVDLDSLYKESTSTRFEPHRPEPGEDVAEDAALMQALEDSIARQKAKTRASEPPGGPLGGENAAA